MVKSFSASCGKKKEDRLKGPKTGLFWAIQKEVISNPKQLNCKKKSVASKKAMVKKDVNPRWRPRNGCDGRLMVKFLTIQVNLVLLGIGTKLT